MKSTSKKTIEADWGEFLGQSGVLTEPPEGYMCIEQILASQGNKLSYVAIQKKMLTGYQAGLVDRVDVKKPGERRKYYYKQN